EQDLVHCVASDMHNLSSRPPFMREAYKLLTEEFGKDKAKALLKKNPLMLLKNQAI
ncbi:CpsB/CapC family capsule biosynthesis tyrosine phosphatase, partial [Streptococcus suis]